MFPAPHAASRRRDAHILSLALIRNTPFSVLGVLAFMTLFLLSAAVAKAAPLAITDFRLHDFDADVAEALGYDRASTVYFSEMGSVTEGEASARTKYEGIGCYPFYVMREGEVQEVGYNCGTFFCTGFVNGPKQCHDRGGASYGGVAEMNRRLGLTYITDDRAFFDSYTAADLTPAMQRRMEELKGVQCRPFYLQRFDMTVGEGYECDEIGRYPYYSGHNVCTNDWRTGNGLQCAIAYRENEMEIRREAYGRMQSSVSSAGGRSSASAASPSPFPDVVPGRYGYTAILALAEQGMVKGYPDGTYKPLRALSRAEFTTLLFRSLGEVPSEARNEAGCFPDVREGQWFSDAVCAAKELGWVKGYDDARFRPHAQITRAEAMKILVAALELPTNSTATLPPDVAEDVWYAASVRTASANGLILEPTFMPGLPSTRADAAVWLYRTLNLLTKGADAVASR
ncbi:MAG: S-layer homology domain-containing protein [Candidatus Peribacteraceae bacterium]|jgi:hypothetical protein